MRSRNVDISWRIELESKCGCYGFMGSVLENICCRCLYRFWYIFEIGGRINIPCKLECVLDRKDCVTLRWTTSENHDRCYRENFSKLAVYALHTHTDRRVQTLDVSVVGPLKIFSNLTVHTTTRSVQLLDNYVQNIGGIDVRETILRGY